MHPSEETKTSEYRERRLEPKFYLFALVGVLIAFYGLGHFLLTNYYTSTIPHYDSVGGYTNGFKILNVSESKGYLAGIAQAMEYRLSMTQSLFAAILSPILHRTPASFHLYNTICVAVALFGMYAFGRGARMTAFGSACLALIYFLPDGLYWWSLGLFDFRRDPGFLGLLTGSYFLILTYLVGDWPENQRRWLGITAGIAMGLALISRDSAPPYMFGIVVIPAFVIWLSAKKTLSTRTWLRVPLAPLCSFAPFALAYGLATTAMLRRITNPLTMYGAGGDRWESFLGNMTSTVKLFIGYPAFSPSLAKEPPVNLGLPYYGYTPAIIIVLFLFVGLLWRTGKMAPRTEIMADQGALASARIPLLSGLWIVGFVHLFLSFVVSWRDDQSLIVTIAPYYTSLIGVYSIIVGFALMFSVRAGWILRAGLFAALSVAVLLAMYLRAESRKPRYPDWSYSLHQTVAKLRNASGGPPTIAELWHDDLRVPAVIFYAAQTNGTAPKRVFYEFEGHTHDFQVGTPSGDPTRANRLRQAMDRAARCQADFILATTNLAGYRQAKTPLILKNSGSEFVGKIFRDLKGRIIHQFGQDTRYPIAILDNRDRVACSVLPAPQRRHR